MYGAFATDFSATASRPGVANGVATWDTYHLTGGTAFEVGGTRFTLGLTYSFGSDQQRVGPPGIDERLPGLAAGARDSKLSYRRFRFILGFAFGG